MVNNSRTPLWFCESGLSSGHEIFSLLPCIMVGRARTCQWRGAKFIIVINATKKYINNPKYFFNYCIEVRWKTTVGIKRDSYIYVLLDLIDIITSGICPYFRPLYLAVITNSSNCAEVKKWSGRNSPPPQRSSEATWHRRRVFFFSPGPFVSPGEGEE